MMCLLKTYESILKNKQKWQYYKGLSIDNELFGNVDASKYFISNYFGTGGKGKIFDGLAGINNLRIHHTISIFFLGIYLSDVILADIDREKHFKPDWKYLWYLTSLFHDYGYSIEDDTEKFPPEKFNTITKICNKLMINHSVLEANLGTPFSNRVIINYYSYCCNSLGFINHGIVGGLYLYDRLSKNLEEKYNDYHRSGGTETIEKFEYNDLLWGSYQKKYFERVAKAIIDHNIWFCVNNQHNCEQKYKNNGLSKIIMDQKCSKKHKLSDDPFLFLLILADTIEPVKHFKNLHPKCVLENIKITTKPQLPEILIEVMDECLVYEPWFKTIKDLETWVGITVNYEGNKLTLSKF